MYNKHPTNSKKTDLNSEKFGLKLKSDSQSEKDWVDIANIFDEMSYNKNDSQKQTLQRKLGSLA